MQHAEHSPGYNPNIALICDPDGRILYFLSREFFSSVATPGQHFDDLLDPGSREKGREFVATIARQGAALAWELDLSLGQEGVITLRCAGGRVGDRLLVIGEQPDSVLPRLYQEQVRINHEQANTLRLTQQSLSSHIRHDSQLIGLYEELSQLNNELATTQRQLVKQNAELARLNELKNQFLGMAAHDLRNPLNVIHLYSQLLIQRLSGRVPDPDLKLADEIERSSRFMSDLINDFLDISRIEAGSLVLRRQPLDLAELVYRNVDLLHYLAEQREVRLRFRCRAPNPPVAVDPSKFRQVLDNLVTNAIDFSPPGGLVTVAVGRRQDWLVVRVRDRGPGIPQDQLKTLFQPFHSVRNGQRRQGTGLGLVIAKKIIERHGGHIQVDSTAGKGAAFTVCLPLPSNSPHSPPTAANT